MKSKTPFIMLIIALFCFTSGCLFYAFYTKYNLSLLFDTFVFFIAIVAHFFIMFLTAPIVQIVFKKKFDYNSNWFKLKKYENQLYAFLKIKKWKNKIVTYNKKLYSVKKHSLIDTIMLTCHAEVVHELIAVTSYLPIILGAFLGDYHILVVMSVVFSVAHVPFILVQRYNRPRLVSLYFKYNSAL